MTAPNCRWFRLAFSLRMLFVLVTLAALSFGVIYHLRWIRLRQEFLNAHAPYRPPPLTPIKHITPRRIDRTPTGLGPDRSAPGLLWLFGETGHITLKVEVDLDRSGDISPRGQEQVQQIRGLFPEADIVVMGGQRNIWFMAHSRD